uniref:Rhoptry neck protein RON4 n=1 Tax=Macrostomum lignano TaxID=282301 RepID=A0A1I8F6Q1_9PLAT
SSRAFHSSPRRRRHLQRHYTRWTIEHLDANFSSFTDQASTVGKPSTAGYPQLVSQAFQSSLGRRRHLQQMTPGDYEHLDAGTSRVFTDQASTVGKPQLPDTPQLVSQAFRHHPDAVRHLQQVAQLVSQAFRHHPDAVGTFNRWHQGSNDTV